MRICRPERCLPFLFSFFAPRRFVMGSLDHQKIRAFRFCEVLREAIFCQAKGNFAVIYQYYKKFSCRMAKNGSLKTEFNLSCLGYADGDAAQDPFLHFYTRPRKSTFGGSGSRSPLIAGGSKASEERDRSVCP